MPQLFTVPAGNSIAHATATHILARHNAAELATTVIFVPNRRSAVVMRAAFQQALAGKASLLPRILPLAEIGNELLTLLGDEAFTILESIPIAMSGAQQRYLLTEQVAAFERRRMGAVSLGYALTLADALMQLQENCARNGVSITQEKLRPLVHADFATHWNQALLFLGILTNSWPAIEEELGLTISACREVLLMHALANHWSKQPATFPVYAVGSTASQPATAALLKTIADMRKGQVILPGIDPSIKIGLWNGITAGHPLYHLKSFLDLWPVKPADIELLGELTDSLWLEALVPASVIPEWEARPLPEYQNIRIIPCMHTEEEVRTITLLLREAIENADQHVALITPDEGLMARVAAHMKRYDILVDRLNAGTLATTQTGSLWAALIAAISEPERQLHLRSLLHHPLLAIDTELLNGLEKGWHGINRSRTGQLPRHDAALKDHPQYIALTSFVQQLARHTRSRLSASAWFTLTRELLAPWVQVSGQAHEAVMEQLEELIHADAFGMMSIEDFAALLAERLDTSWRDAGLNTHPRIHLLTPVEARMQHFDRVILANMQEQLWPGTRHANPWLNLAAEQAIGLPGDAEHISLMAHDVLMLASSGDVFLTYPKRDGGSPATRSRFIERLVTLLACHGITENEITDTRYSEWEDAQYVTEYVPEEPVYPRPSAAQRPDRLPVTAIDSLFTDPFSIYAKHVLGLRKLDDIDANPEASDFGSLAHKAIEMLTIYWNVNGTAPGQEDLENIAEHALRAISDRPNIDLFWRTRLLGGLRYVNHLETQCRKERVEVVPEQVVSARVALPDQSSIELYGRIDRLEQRAAGASIIDHKTGEIPSEKNLLDGRALQLLAYAMVLEANGQKVEAVEYWQLPRIGDEGETLRTELDTRFENIEQKLREALAQMRDAATPFLARPVSTSAAERFTNDFDGISRYDEWAG